MDTPNDLIKSLTADLKPVKPIAPLWQRVLAFAVLGFALSFAAAFVVGPRNDLGAALGNSRFVLEVLSLVFAGILSASAAATLAVPDTRLRLPVKLPLALSQIIWVWLLTRTMTDTFNRNAMHMAGEGQCGIDLALMLILPLAAGTFIMMRGAPVWRGLAGYAMTLSMVSFAAAAMRFLCPNDAAGHLLLWHFLPALGIAAAGVVLGLVAFRRR